LEVVSRFFEVGLMHGSSLKQLIFMLIKILF